MTDLRELFDDLVRFETILWNAIDARLQRECGLTMSSLNAMLVIDATPACRVQDIAAAVAITVGGASQAVDRLEAAGHCVRRPNPEDRRSSVLDLTPAGRKLLAGASTVFDQELESFLNAPLSDRSLDQLAAALSKLRRAATESAAPPEQP